MSSRRSFLAAAGSLVIAFQLPVRAAAQAPQGAVFSPNAYLRIGADDSITIVVALVEMGQGTFTSIPMLIAEELEVGLSGSGWSRPRQTRKPTAIRSTSSRPPADRPRFRRRGGSCARSARPRSSCS